MQPVIWQSVAYALGAVGLFAIGALPLRTYMLFRSARAGSKPAWLGLSILVVALVSVLLTSQFLLQLGRCLLGYHCSANTAGGWINAAFIGVIYLAFEIIAFAIRRFGGRGNAAA